MSLRIKLAQRLVDSFNKRNHKYNSYTLMSSRDRIDFADFYMLVYQNQQDLSDEYEITMDELNEKALSILNTLTKDSNEEE